MHFIQYIKDNKINFAEQYSASTPKKKTREKKLYFVSDSCYSMARSRRQSPIFHRQMIHSLQLIDIV